MVLPVGPSSISEASSAHTLQAFIELVYVKTANDVLLAHMASLESALGVTQRTMDVLTQLQTLKNEVKAVGKSTFNPSYFNQNTYKASAEAFFKTPVQIGANVISGFPQFLSEMQGIRTKIINSLIPQLSAITPRVSGQEDSNSLLAKMRNVLNDINANGAHLTSGGAKNWLIDKFNESQTLTVTSAGLIQQHLTNAITSGQSLNTTQTESVRNFLNIYEEYYKSASAVLTAMTQIIQKMADGIAR